MANSSNSVRKEEATLLCVLGFFLLLGLGAWWLNDLNRTTLKEECELKGGRVLVTVEGRICAKVEVIK